MALVASVRLTPVAGQCADAGCGSKGLCRPVKVPPSDSENISQSNSCACALKNNPRQQNDSISSSKAPSSVPRDGNEPFSIPNDNSALNSSAVNLVVDANLCAEKLAFSIQKSGLSSSPSVHRVEMVNNSSLVGSEISISRITRTGLCASEVTGCEDRLHPVPTGASERESREARELDRDRRLPPAEDDGLLPPEFFAEAEQELHEKQKWIDRDVEALREMVLQEEGLRARTDTAFLLTFLRARKFHYEKAFAMVQGYYQSRQTNEAFYTSLTVGSLAAVWDQRLQTILPTPDRHGRTVLVFRAGAWNPSVLSLDEVFKAQVLLLEHVVRRPLTQLKGIAAVVDCAGLGRTHAYNLTAAHVRRMVAVVQEVFPLRFKALHFINEPLMFEWMFSLVKPLLSDTIKKRLHFHGTNLQGLLEHIPAEALPSELGGSGPPMDNTELVHILTGQEPYFADHFSYGYATKIRPSSRTSFSRNHRRPLPRSMSVSDAGRQGRLPSSSVDCGPALRPEDCVPNASLRGSVTDVGSMLGFYYRRMCID